jgi:threonine aldolase
LLETGAWLRNATHANYCASYLARRIEQIANVQLAWPVEANTVFLHAPEPTLECLRQRGWQFYTFIGGAARFMFAWDTKIERIDELVHDLEECARA